MCRNHSHVKVRVVESLLVEDTGFLVLMTLQPTKLENPDGPSTMMPAGSTLLVPYFRGEDSSALALPVMGARFASMVRSVERVVPDTDTLWSKSTQR
jgi:hypothetical protein